MQIKIIEKNIAEIIEKLCEGDRITFDEDPDKSITGYITGKKFPYIRLDKEPLEGLTRLISELFPFLTPGIKCDLRKLTSYEIHPL